ncbi:hypothetical protein ACFYL6_06470 [Micromonospora sp. NPDC007208]|uniref:hypothetical protein n=1 Tax=Micromonospora sp. NPDC007208 TaxID=3364236 RepID=UPI0036847FE9
MTKHGPVLPLWLCETCDRPWPCAPRRDELLGEHAATSISLALYMGACVLSARKDMSWAPPDALRRRFLGWMP